MDNFSVMTIAAGLLATLALVYFALVGPSQSKAQGRRLDSLRERHSKSTEVAAQAQLKRILASVTSDEEPDEKAQGASSLLGKFNIKAMISKKKEAKAA